jgi:hypothetical protein
MGIGMENGTIRLVIDTTRLAYLLHESCYCNHRLAPDFRDQTAGLTAWLLDILFKDASLAYSTLAPASRVPTVRASPSTCSLPEVAPREVSLDGDS